MCARKTRSAWRAVASLALVAATVLATAPAGCGAAVATLGEVTLQLHSARYYRNGDYTRFVYQVTTPPGRICDAWVLGLCDAALAAAEGLAGEAEPVQTPIVGVAFVPRLRNEKFYLYLRGSWSVAPTQVAARVEPEGDGRWVSGWIDGPSCEGSSLSIDVVSGGELAFPDVTGPGLFRADAPTTLRVVSSSSGWALTWLEQCEVPEGGSAAALERIFEVSVGPYASTVGSTDVLVEYALRVEESDFGSLPEGVYEITITYTVTTD